MVNPPQEAPAMRMVLAPDKFKGCLRAAEVAEALRLGVQDARPDVGTEVVPVADGGEGTVDAALAVGFEQRWVDAVGPTGEVVRAAYALRGREAVLELAGVAGQGRLPGGHPDPLGATTFGLGLVLSDALQAGATDIVVGLGGSASTDGGAGLLAALGARLIDSTGRPVAMGGAALDRLDAVDLTPVRERLRGIRLRIAADVDNPLLGPRGAAAVFGPQKGAGPAEVAMLERAMARWAGLIGPELAGRPGAGAAGGTAYGLLAVGAADLVPGAELMLALTGLGRRAAGAGLVVTGEGSLDEQTLAGKAPLGVLRAVRAARMDAVAEAGGATRAAAWTVPVVVAAGRCTLNESDWRSAGFAAVYPLTELEPDESRCLADAPRLLRRLGARITREWLP